MAKKSTKPRSRRTKPTPAPAKPGARWLGWAADDDPIYQSGWNYLSGKNLNPQSVAPSTKPKNR